LPATVTVLIAIHRDQHAALPDAHDPTEVGRFANPVSRLLNAKIGATPDHATRAPNCGTSTDACLVANSRHAISLGVDRRNHQHNLPLVIPRHRILPVPPSIRLSKILKIVVGVPKHRPAFSFIQPTSDRSNKGVLDVVHAIAGDI
jgi:hypothetical protein